MEAARSTDWITPLYLLSALLNSVRYCKLRADVTVGIVLVSHSAPLAEGLAELLAQIGSSDVPVAVAGGTPDGRLGTSVELVEKAIPAAAGFTSSVSIGAGDRHVDARSVLLVMSLGAVKDSDVTIRATGEDAEQAVRELSGILAAARPVDAASG